MTQITTFRDFAAQLREFISCHDSESVAPDNAKSGMEFERLALSLFRLQLTHNAPYRRFCEGRKVGLQNVTSWGEIPGMPAAGFKELEMTSLAPEQRTRVFHSSGTTAQTRSRHFHNAESLSIYEASLLPWFRRHFPNEQPAAFLILTPSPEAAPNSSLVHMFEVVREKLGGAESIFAGEVADDGGWQVDFSKTTGFLDEAVGANRNVTLLGTAFSFVHLLDWLEEKKIHIRLPPGSRQLETGGYKGRSRVLTKCELHERITRGLGVADDSIICEYGMSELSSQAYDGIAGQCGAGDRVFRFPPWARAQIVNPETGIEVCDGETGLIRVFDLANVYSAMAIQTEDLGIRRGDGFELLGRAALAETRGCSLMSI